jgi:hypothetical protein
MKNIFKLTFVAFALVMSFVSCDNIDLDGFEPNVTSGWVEFEEESDQVFNDSGTITIGMEYNVPVNQVNTTVNYTVEVIEGEAPGAVTGSFVAVVPRNTRDLSIDYAIDPTITTNYTLLFTIESTSNPDVIIGLDGDNPDTHTLEVCFNDFPLSYTGNAFIEGELINTFDMTLTETETPGEYTISSAWGTNFVAEATGNPAFDGLFIYDGNFTLNPDFTVSITGFDTNFFPGTIPNDDPLNLNGNQYDRCTKTLTYTLEQGLFGGDFVVDVVLTPAP